MTLLLDTHTALWFWWADPRLSTTATAIICDPANRKLVSSAAAWDLAVKVSLMKLDIGRPYRGFFPQQMLRNNFEWLPSTDDHLALCPPCPSTTKTRSTGCSSPKAMWENIPIVSADAVLDLYGISRLW